MPTSDPRRTRRPHAWRPVLGLGLLLLLAAGCAGARAGGGEEDVRWTERRELAVGEPGVFAGGSLIITPTEVGDAHALVTVEGADTSLEGRLTTDPGGFVTVRGHRIYLLAADAGRRAVVAVGPAG